VQKEVLSRGPTAFLQVPFRSLLGYAYRVNGSSYGGFFALIAEDRETADKLQRQAEGTPVIVRYNPKAQEESLLENRELLRRRIIQDPFYLDPSWQSGIVGLIDTLCGQGVAQLPGSREIGKVPPAKIHLTGKLVSQDLLPNMVLSDDYNRGLWLRISLPG